MPKTLELKTRNKLKEYLLARVEERATNFLSKQRGKELEKIISKLRNNLYAKELNELIGDINTQINVLTNKIKRFGCLASKGKNLCQGITQKKQRVQMQYLPSPVTFFKERTQGIPVKQTRISLLWSPIRWCEINAYENTVKKQQKLKFMNEVRDKLIDLQKNENALKNEYIDSMMRDGEYGKHLGWYAIKYISRGITGRLYKRAIALTQELFFELKPHYLALPQSFYLDSSDSINASVISDKDVLLTAKSNCSNNRMSETEEYKLNDDKTSQSIMNTHSNAKEYSYDVMSVSKSDETEPLFARLVS